MGGDEMDETQSPLHPDFRVAELLESALEEERHKAGEAVEVMNEVVEKLKPLLEYVTALRPSLKGSTEPCGESPKGFVTSRAKTVGVVEITREKKSEATEILFLTAEGRFFIAVECKRDSTLPSHEHVKVGVSRPAWQLFPYETILAALHNLLAHAAQRKELIREDAKEWHLKFKKILRILREPAKAEPHDPHHPKTPG